MAKILITGASGFVGTKFYDLLKKEGHDVYGTYCKHPKEGLIYANTEDRCGFWNIIKEIRPNTVIHTVSIARADECKKDPELAYRVNIIGARDVARACNNFGSTMVFLSTSHVFPPGNGLHKETDELTRGADTYGNMKVIAEHVVKNELPERHIIVRSDLLLGINPDGPCHLFGEAAEGDLQYKVNKLRQPLLLEDYLTAIETLVNKRKTGIYHIARPDTIPYGEILEEISEITGSKVDSPDNTNIDLSKSILLDTSKVASLGIKPRDYDEMFSFLESQFKSVSPEKCRKSVEH